MIQMDSYRNRDSERFVHCSYHGSNYFKTAHVLAGSCRYTKNNRCLHLLSGLKDCLCPLEVIDIELTYAVMSGFCFFEHLRCVNDHFLDPPI